MPCIVCVCVLYFFAATDDAFASHLIHTVSNMSLGLNPLLEHMPEWTPPLRHCSPPDWSVSLAQEALVNGSFIEQHGKPCFSDASVDCAEAAEWDRHWQDLQGTVRGRLFSLYRRQIRARCVARYVTRYFQAPGLYVECGCGSSETSCRIRPQSGQTFLALDFADRPLGMALRQPCHSGGIQADIRQLPFANQSLDGLWNLGVMEHFEEDEQLTILREFHRVLKPGGQLLLWWPPKFALDLAVVSCFGWKFPNEPGRASRDSVAHLLRTTGFNNVAVSFPLSDGLTELLAAGVASAVTA